MCCFIIYIRNQIFWIICISNKVFESIFLIFAKEGQNPILGKSNLKLYFFNEEGTVLILHTCNIFHINVLKLLFIFKGNAYSMGIVLEEKNVSFQSATNKKKTSMEIEVAPHHLSSLLFPVLSHSLNF